jgi:beta-mannanase
MEASRLIGTPVVLTPLRRARRASAPLILLAAILALVGYRGIPMLSARAPGIAAWPAVSSASASVDIGITTAPLARDEWRAWQPSDLESVNAFEQLVRKHISVVMWYSDWRHNSVSLSQLRAVAQRGSVPEITWEPWDYTEGIYGRHPNYNLQSIIDGNHDAYIRSWARTLAAYGKPVRLRFAQEMNGNWYPWSESANGNSPGQFVEAWRHVHDLFQAARAVNVRWVWSPVALAGTITAEQYPGDRYVDIVGLSAFNGGIQLEFDRWQSFAAKIGRPLTALQKVAPGKPIEISEVGSAEQGGSKAQWISAMFQTLKAHPQITSVVWYDLSKSSDWRVESSPAATAAFAAAASDPRYR